MRTYAREQNEIWKKQFTRVSSHDFYWENKTYKLTRSIVGQPSVHRASKAPFVSLNEE